MARLRGEVANDALEVRVFVVEPPELDEHLLISRQGPLDALGQERQIRLRHGGEASDALARDEKCTGSSGAPEFEIPLESFLRARLTRARVA